MLEVAGAATAAVVNHLPTTITTKPNFPSNYPNVPRNLHFPPPSSTSSKSKSSIIYIPPKPPISPQIPSISDTSSTELFQEKLIYLETLGVDLFSLLTIHPPLISTSLSDLQSTVSFLYSVGLTTPDIRRAISMCPEFLSSPPSKVISVFTFLLREAHVSGYQLRRVIHRRPRLLACDVHTQLRPALYFLQGTIGISETHRHTHLLSCSVEKKFVPRIEYFHSKGFSSRETISIFRRFPSLFCYSIKENLEPKYNYFVVEMGRDLKELIQFPQCFSFSLENRIKPRHKQCVEKGVCLPLPEMLTSNKYQFRERLEVCCNSSIPVGTSPLWCTNCDPLNEL